jgi:TRAP-type mannitol/chloroaromatic compound transport system permease small subunit
MDLRGVFEKLNRLAAVAGRAAARIGIPAMVALFAFEPVARWLGVATGGAPGDFATLLFFAVVMLGFGYGYAEDAHVRIDVLSRRFSPRTRATIELAGILLVLTPLCVAIIAYGADSAWRSFLQGETFGDSGLALQWIVRALAPLGFALLLAAGLANAARALRLIFRREP